MCRSTVICYSVLTFLQETKLTRLYILCVSLDISWLFWLQDCQNALGSHIVNKFLLNDIVTNVYYNILYVLLRACKIPIKWNIARSWWIWMNTLINTFIKTALIMMGTKHTVIPLAHDIVIKYFGHLTETTYHLPLILFVYLYFCQTICWTMTCDNIILPLVFFMWQSKVVMSKLLEILLNLCKNYLQLRSQL